MARKKDNVVSMLARKYNTPTSDIEIMPPRNALESDNLFIGSTADNSLIGRHILKGDYVLVNADAEINQGDIAVVEIGGKMAIRIVNFIGGGFVSLESANSLYNPVTQRLSEAKLIGRVIRIERDF